MRSRTLPGVLLIGFLLPLAPAPVRAQPSDTLLASPTRFEAGVQLAALRLTGADATDAGIGARVGWLRNRTLSLEASAEFYPASASNVIRGGRKFHALAGPTFTWRRPRVGLFVGTHGGIARVSKGRQRGACILSEFPPPEGCYGGDTRLAAQLGGGVEIYSRTGPTLRLEFGTLVTRLGSSSSRFGRSGVLAADPRIATGIGFRF